MALATNTTPGEIQLAGDLAGNNDATAPELTDVGIAAGQYQYPKITVDSKGRTIAIESGDPNEFGGLLAPASATERGVVQAGVGLSVSESGTAGYQEIIFNTSIDGSEASDLNNCASYAISISVNFGATQVINLIVVDLSTINKVITELNKKLGGAVAAVVSGKIRITSNTIGRDTVVTIISDNLFKCVSGFASINSPVTGTASCLMSADLATISSPGIVQIGSGLTVFGDGIVTASIATSTQLGTVKVGAGLSITVDGVLSATAIPDATISSKGIVQIGNNISVNAGVISVATAENSTLGVVKTANTNNLSIISGSIDIGPDVALLNASNNWLVSQSVTTSTLIASGSPAAAINVDADVSNVFEVELLENTILNNPINLAAGGRYSFVIKQDIIGSRLITYGTAYKFKNGSDKTLTTTPSATDILMCVSDGTNLYCSLAKDFV